MLVGNGENSAVLLACRTATYWAVHRNIVSLEAGSSTLKLFRAGSFSHQCLTLYGQYTGDCRTHVLELNRVPKYIQTPAMHWKYFGYLKKCLRRPGVAIHGWMTRQWDQIRRYAQQWRTARWSQIGFGVRGNLYEELWNRIIINTLIQNDYVSTKESCFAPLKATPLHSKFYRKKYGAHENYVKHMYLPRLFVPFYSRW